MRAEHWRPLSVAVIRAAIRHRTNGHAAEIAFFGLLSLVPATITLGGMLHLFAHIGGPALAARGQQGANEAIRLLIGPKLADSVINPFVTTQLEQSRGLAITGVVATAWLASRMFYALSHGFDVAFGVGDRRPSRIQRLFALAHAVVAVVVVALTLAVMVLGWHSGRAGIDRFLGRAPVVAQLWLIVRWPILIAVLLGVIVGLYRYGPNIRLPVRQCVPGALLAVILWIGAAVAFRAYLLVGAADPTGVQSRDPRVVLIGRAIGASIATAVWMYFSALAILTGAELNGELIRRANAAAARTPEARAGTTAAVGGGGATPASRLPHFVGTILAGARLRNGRNPNGNKVGRTTGSSPDGDRLDRASPNGSDERLNGQPSSGRRDRS